MVCCALCESMSKKTTPTNVKSASMANTVAPMATPCLTMAEFCHFAIAIFGGSIDTSLRPNLRYQQDSAKKQ